MELNIDKINEEKNKKMTKDKNLEDYDKFYKKDNYKISLINIDSAFREKNPKNIYSANVTYLPQDPLTFTSNSSLITINYPNHNLLAGDTFVISDSETDLNGVYVVESVVNKNTLIFTSGNTSVINTTKGNFLKELSNNINLLAGKYVNIPQDIQLNIGRTSSK